MLCYVMLCWYPIEIFQNDDQVQSLIIIAVNYATGSTVGISARKFKLKKENFTEVSRFRETGREWISDF